MITTLNLSQPVEHRATVDPHAAMVDAALTGTGYTGTGVWRPSVLSARTALYPQIVLDKQECLS